MGVRVDVAGSGPEEVGAPAGVVATEDGVAPPLLPRLCWEVGLGWRVAGVATRLTRVELWRELSAMTFCGRATLPTPDAAAGADPIEVTLGRAGRVSAAR